MASLGRKLVEHFLICAFVKLSTVANCPTRTQKRAYEMRNKRSKSKTLVPHLANAITVPTF
jgi:hypothetical protein